MLNKRAENKETEVGETVLTEKITFFFFEIDKILLFFVLILNIH